MSGTRPLLAAAVLAVAIGSVPASRAQEPLPAFHDVEVYGEGVDEPSALRAAFVKALQATLGAVVHSETSTVNFSLKEDLVRILTNGCIESYTELSRSSADGVTRVKIRARVRRGLVADLFTIPDGGRALELKDEWARLTTMESGRQQALEFLRSLSGRVARRLYSVSLVDLKTGNEVGSFSNSVPATQPVADSKVDVAWGAVVRPDLKFWDEHAAPLFESCLEALCEQRGRLYVRMEGELPDPSFYENTPEGFDGSFERVPSRRWQRIPSWGLPPWHGAEPVPLIKSAPKIVVVHGKASHRAGTGLSMYYLRKDAFQDLASSGEGKTGTALGEIPLIIRARLSFEGGAQATTYIGQFAPTLFTIGIPWTGATEAHYLGPLFPAGWMNGGWALRSAWPEWEGIVMPVKKVPGFDSFLIEDGRIYRADGGFEDAHRKLVRVQRGGNFREALADFEFDEHLVVPIVFRMGIEDLRKIRQISVELVDKVDE